MKFGRLPARHNIRTMRGALVMARHLDLLGPPPASGHDYITQVENAVGTNWQMFGNDNVGDCVVADTGHEVMLMTANTSGIVVGTTQDAENYYFAETSGQDSGLDETSDCQLLVKQGITFGGQLFKPLATGMIDPANTAHVQWCCQLFGGVKLGLNWTQQMMDQFNAGQQITPDPNGTVLGGHDVYGLWREQFWIITWGKRCSVSSNFFAGCEEAHALLWRSLDGTPVDQLVADLNAIES